MERLIATGILEIPEGWEVRTEAVLIAPASSDLTAPLSVAKSSGQPRANVVVRRALYAEADCVELLRETLKEAALPPGSFKVSEIEPFTFDDGTTGARQALQLKTGPTGSVLQEHIVRIDADVATHMTGTVVHTDASAMENLVALMRCFRPSA